MIPLENKIRFKFIPSITSGAICSEYDRNKIWRSYCPLFNEIASFKYEKSKKLSTSWSQLVKDRSKVYHVNEIDQRDIRWDIRSEREHCYKTKRRQIRLNNISQEKGVPNWLTSYPNSENGLDSIRTRYGWELTNIHLMCACGHKMDM